jgi:8-oxo-dGTP diphosphatase
MSDAPTVEPNQLTVYTVVLLERAQHYLLLRRSEAMRWNPGRWTGVGGRVEADELDDLRSAALRELFEETGIAEPEVTRFAFRRALLHAWPTRLSMVLLLYFTGSVATAALPSCPEGTLAWVAATEFAALDVIDSTRPVLPLLVADMVRDPMGLEPLRVGVAPVVGGLPGEILWA